MAIYRPTGNSKLAKQKFRYGDRDESAKGNSSKNMVVMRDPEIIKRKKKIERLKQMHELKKDDLGW